MSSDTVVPFIIAALATYRVSYALTSEDGPFYVFSSIRKRLMDWERRRGRPHWIIDGVHCILCVSVYVAFLFALVVPFSAWYDYLAIGFALSSITLILKKQLS